MITSFKIFESVNVYNLDDYVLCKSDITELNDFLSENVGKIIDIDNDKYSTNNDIRFNVKYYNVPKNIMSYMIPVTNKYRYGTNIPWSRKFYLKDIVYGSKIKEDIELKISANKYNI